MQPLSASLPGDGDQHYNAQYYAHGLGEPCHRGSAIWQAFFGAVADAIVGDLHPRTVLDAGCGMGILVEQLRRRKVDAGGFDISAYAIGELPHELKAHCTVGSILDPIVGDYDLIVCIEVLEHLRPELARTAVANLARHTPAILFSSTPEDFREPTHLNVRPTAFWAALFARHGFYRDHNFDASVVASHAVLLRRERGSIVPIVREYEAERWRTGVEIRELRAAHLADSQERAQLSADLERATAEAERVAGELERVRGELAFVTAERDRLRAEVPEERDAPRGEAPEQGAEWGGTLGEPPTGDRERAGSATDDTAPGDAAMGDPAPAEPDRAAEPHTLHCAVETPAADSVLSGRAIVSGWAVDHAGTADTGVDQVRIFLDDQLKGSATYGLPRLDVAAHFGSSTFTDSGWHFALDPTGVPNGPHDLEARVRSSLSGREVTFSRTVQLMQEASVGRTAKSATGGPPHADADQVAQPASLQCTIEAPAVDAVVRVLAILSGWAVDRASTADTGVDEVRIFLDGELKGVATYGLPRLDVGAHFGSSRFTDSGWRFALDLAGVSTGPHEVRVLAHSSSSGQTAASVHPLIVQEPTLVTPRQRVALFMSGSSGDAARYRCDHAVEQLQMLGVSADSALYEQVALGEVLDEYQLFVLHRVPYGEDIAWFLEQARQRDKRVIFDTDDLAFDMEATRFIAALDDMSEAQREHFLESVARCRETLLRCDAVLVSTHPLRELAGALNENVAILPNVVSAAMVRDAASARHWWTTRRSDREATRALTIAYLSGTATHNRDFLEAADAVVYALEHFPHTRFLTLGPVALDERFLMFGDRVERRPLQPWRRLPDVLAGVDVSLAPLEPFNPFTDSKSCIKFLEAGLLGVPTIASPRSDFTRAIEHGVNGLLADSPEEWRDALCMLIESAEARERIGTRARENVEQQHSTAAAARVLGRTVGSLAVTPGEPRLTINVLLPSSTEGDAAARRDILRVARGLVARQHHVRICLDPDAARPDRPANHDPDDCSLDGLDVYPRQTDLPAADVSVATDCTTAYRVSQHDLSLFKVHYLRELERDRYPRSQRRADEIERAYDLPLRIVCATAEIGERIAQITARPIDCLPAAPDDVSHLEHVLLEACFARLDAS